ncbi:MAG: Ig-like domain-containing protein [Myxococcota bacterium]|nr:hypothetical protein [Deltaproteobacteria bacterium]MDQ3334791.1 Ig-like domain-containing protein [Myxococcota bacterium]
MVEKFIDNTMPMKPVEKSRRVFAFGTHELAGDDEVASTRPAGMVTSAAALNGALVNQLRVIVDELLVGNYLEEIACRGQVDADFLSRVPLGATPEDIARCAGPDDVLPRTCAASNPLSVCICKNPNGCLANTKIIDMGMPVGVADIDKDGAADDTELINGAVNILCGPGLNIKVPLDLKTSYWNPSGDQNRPALGGFDALGPAIVISPAGALPTNVECQLAFANGTLMFPDANDPQTPLPAITDKQNLKLCTPPNGDVAQPCTADGDLSQFKFKVEPIQIVQAPFDDNSVGVSRNIGMPSGIDFLVNVPLSVPSLATITVNPPLPAGATITLVGVGFNARTIRISGPAGTQLLPNTMYTITIGTGVTDTFNQPLPQPFVIRFTTAP